MGLGRLWTASSVMWQGHVTVFVCVAISPISLSASLSLSLSNPNPLFLFALYTPHCNSSQISLGQVTKPSTFFHCEPNLFRTRTRFSLDSYNTYVGKGFVITPNYAVTSQKKTTGATGSSEVIGEGGKNVSNQE